MQIIKYQVTASSISNITLTKLLGNYHQNLLNERKDFGDYNIELSTSGLPSGVYFLRYSSGNQTAVVKLIVVRRYLFA